MVEEHVARVIRIPIARVYTMVALDLTSVVIAASASVWFTDRGPLMVLAAISGMVVSRIVAPSRIRAAKHTPSSRSTAGVDGAVRTTPADVRGMRQARRTLIWTERSFGAIDAALSRCSAP